MGKHSFLDPLLTFFLLLRFFFLKFSPLGVLSVTSHSHIQLKMRANDHCIPRYFLKEFQTSTLTSTPHPCSRQQDSQFPTSGRSPNWVGGCQGCVQTSSGHRWNFLEVAASKVCGAGIDRWRDANIKGASPWIWALPC